MNDEQERQPDEDEKAVEEAVEETVSEDAPEEAPPKPAARVHDDEDDYEPITVEALKDEAKEIAGRVKAAGLNPLRRIARGIIYPLLDTIDGFAEALEGNKRKRND